MPAPDECILSSSDFSTSELRDNVQINDVLTQNVAHSDTTETVDINIECNTTDVAGIESVIPGHQNRKRKRRGQAEPNEWKKNVRKNKRQKGEPHLSSKGFLNPGKSLGESKCMGMCREKCTNKFSEEDRLEIFSSFWNIENIDQKRQYIVGIYV